MQNNRNKEPLQYDPEIERTRWQQRKQAINQTVEEEIEEVVEEELEFNMGENANHNANAPQPRRTVGSFIPPNPRSCGSSIVTPTINANNFLLKPQLVALVQQNCQFSRSPQEDPNLFISNFLQICDTVKTSSVLLEMLIKLRAVIQTFRQHEGNSLYEDWKRYKEMLRKCPPDMFVD
ncbi:hypothetical protein AHAS_Ahas11G0173900 [Arachis hypogaea]